MALLLVITIWIISVTSPVVASEILAQHEEIPFDIAAVGDISCVSDDEKPHGNETISTIEEQIPHLVVFLGDLAYSEDMECFFNSIKSLEHKVNDRVLVALGNHDISSEGNENTKMQLMEKFGMPIQGYYNATFDNGRILIVVMNYTGLEKGNEKYTLLAGSPQYAFMKKTLENSDSRYKIVVSHAPFKACNCPQVHQPLDGVYETYNPLFQDTGVSIVLSAHNHNYQRYKVDNVTYVTNGLGGKSFYPVPDDHSEEGLEQLFDIENGYGVSLFSINSNSIHGKFVSNNDKEIDIFEIQLTNNSRSH